MIKFVVLAILVVAVSARPQEDLQVLKNYNDGAEGEINWGVELSDGTKNVQKGYVENPGTPDAKTVITEGEYSYPLADGRIIRVKYTSDASGFKPVITFE